jgi:hypothetical protein
MILHPTNYLPIILVGQQSESSRQYLERQKERQLYVLKSVKDQYCYKK